MIADAGKVENVVGVREQRIARRELANITHFDDQLRIALSLREILEAAADSDYQ